MKEQMQALWNFKRCAEAAPEGTYEETKKIERLIGEHCDQLIKEVKQLGLNADTCDLIFKVEMAIYGYIKESNPGATVFPVSEGFGASMDTDARDRVIAQAARDRDFLSGVSAS